jgi:hypothetical protein
MDPLQDSIIEELVQQKLEGKSYTEIRARLREEGLDEEGIRQAIRKIDEQVLEAEVNQRHIGRARQWYRVGFTLAVLGLVLTLSSNQGIILEDTPRWLVYAPFFAGIVLMFYGRMSQRRQQEIYQKGPGRIRRKRPFK